MKNIKINFLTIFLLLFLFGFCDGSWLRNANQTNVLFMRTLRYIKSPKVDNFTSILFPISSDTNKLDTCKPYLPPTVIPGSVIFAIAYGGCDFQTHALLAQNLNASAVILISASPDINAISVHGDFSKVKIPVYFIDERTAKEMSKVFIINYLNKFPTYIFIEENENTFQKRTNNGGWIFFQVLMMLTLTISFLIAIRGLFLAIKNSGVSLNIQKICLLNNLLSIIFLFLSLLDPWSSHSYMRYEFIFTTTILSVPSIIMSLSLMSFFLNEVLIQRKMMEPKLDYFKYPFLGFSVAQWAVYIAFVVTLNVKLAAVKLIRANLILTLIFLFSIFVYFTIVGGVMIKKLMKFKNKMFKKVFPLVIFQSFGILVFIVADCIFIAIYYLEKFNPDLYLACWTSYWIAANIIVFAQVLTFRKPKISSSTKDKQFENLEIPGKMSSALNTGGKINSSGSGI
eukprot:TRINITY_DN965_c0_g2_i3.p1 TRINITY_DN965_c0_g2~~TRINITY_DN965_c0_g2_i3.p1  ORF type:complete len:455 (+),score=52.78 TRINITY_DN965_c0_g2_i3:77-1441(+)